MPKSNDLRLPLREAFSRDRFNVALHHISYKARERVFSQGDRSDAVYFIESGKIKLTVVSRRGKEVIIGFQDPNNFLGEQCLAGEPSRAMSATAVEDCSLLRIEGSQMHQILLQDPHLSASFISYLLRSNLRLYEDLVDHFFNHSEKRLARVLLSLANYAGESKVEEIFLRINQETLAELVGTTRGRISFFMNKFRKEGLIEYKGNAGVHIHNALINVLLRE